MLQNPPLASHRLVNNWTRRILASLTLKSLRTSDHRGRCRVHPAKVPVLLANGYAAVASAILIVPCRSSTDSNTIIFRFSASWSESESDGSNKQGCPTPAVSCTTVVTLVMDDRQPERCQSKCDLPRPPRSLEKLVSTTKWAVFELLFLIVQSLYFHSYC